jgi:hypothetical protein
LRTFSTQQDVGLFGTGQDLDHSGWQLADLDLD